MIDGAQFNEPGGENLVNIHPTILSKFVSSNPSECPVLSMHWQLDDGTAVDNSLANDTNHRTVKIVNPDSSCWKGTPLGGETTQANCASPPTSAVLRVNNTLKFSYTFRLHAYTFAKDAYLELPIHVCGFETLTLVNSTQKLIVLAYAQGDVASMSDSQRWYTIPQSTFAPYFQVSHGTPGNTQCGINYYELLDHNDPYVKWPAARAAVTWSGSFGSH
jgi:hypothetical protein